jgi:hypothetical protein
VLSIPTTKTKVKLNYAAEDALTSSADRLDKESILKNVKEINHEELRRMEK